MRIMRADLSIPKGWYAGPWNSPLSASVGYANQGIDDPHVHTRITEVYLVARGSSVIRVGRESIALEAGDMIMVEPGEPHTFVSSSPDYFHFVLHVRGLQGDEARAEKHPISRSQLDL